jgi:uncharacterized membrane protein YfcA
VTSWLVTLVVGVIAGTISGVVGTGASILLLPILVYQYGPQYAVPVMAIASLLSNVGKMAAWWRDIDWRACLLYALPGIPAAALGAKTLLVLPPRVVDVALGAFFLAMIPLRHRRRAKRARVPGYALAAGGAAIGFVTGIVLSTGPLSIPLFAAYGLTRGALLATEAAASLALMATKAATFGALGALPAPALAQGIVIGAAVMAGSFVGKGIVQRMSAHVFERAIDAVLLVAGVALIGAAAR